MKKLSSDTIYSRAQKLCGFNAYIYRQKSPKTTPKL